MRFGSLRPGAINLNTACVSSFSTKEKGRPFETHILTINVSNVGVSLLDMGLPHHLVKVGCEAVLDIVEVEYLRYLGGGVSSSSISISYYRKRVRLYLFFM